ISMTPAFSPGPWITQGALVGSVRRWIFEDLYEQCSFHIAEKMPSSVKVGARPISLRMRAYSSSLSPCAATTAGGLLGPPDVRWALLATLGARVGVRLGGLLGAALAADLRLFALIAAFLGDAPLNALAMLLDVIAQ